jgi:ribose-phosphate pyrophosphokinase
VEYLSYHHLAYPQIINKLSTSMTSKPNDVCILAGTAGQELAAEVIEFLGARPVDMEILRYSDGEVDVEIKDSVRGKNTFVIQPTCPPVNENLMELLVIMDAIERSSGGIINAVLPYYGYSRKERKTKARDPITGKLVADIIEKAGADSALLTELHATAIEGFFRIPTTHLETTKLLANALAEYKLKQGQIPGYLTDISFVEIPETERKAAAQNTVIVSPDVGGARRARNFSRYFGQSDFAIIEKRRFGVDQTEMLSIIGEVEGREAVIVDDMVSTGGSMAPLVKVLREKGATKVYGCITHPLFVGNAVENLKHADFDAFFCTNTVPVPPEKRWNGLHIVSVGKYLGSAIDRIHTDRSINELVGRTG